MRRIYLFIIVLIFSFPNLSQAYSYGDPNQEVVADAYEQMAAALAKEPPNFAEAAASFDQVKEELESHMGKQPVDMVQSALEEQDKDTVITLMQKILVLNIARRLEAVNVTDYPNAKLLLAKK